MTEPPTPGFADLVRRLGLVEDRSTSLEERANNFEEQRHILRGLREQVAALDSRLDGFDREQRAHTAVLRNLEALAANQQTQLDELHRDVGEILRILRTPEE